MITILFVIDTLEVGGTEQSLLQLVRTLPGNQFRCVVCAIYRGNTLANQFENAGANVVSLDLPGKYQFPTAIGKMCTVMKEHTPDLVHTMLFRASQVGRIAAWRRRLPVISSFVNVPYDRSRREVDTASKGWKLKGLQWIDVATARLVDRFHSVSEFAKTSNCHALGVRSDRVVVVPRGRDPGLFPESISNRNADLDRPLVFNVGRLIAQKGQANLIRAMRSVVQQFPTAQLKIAGNGPLQDSLSQLAGQFGLADRVELLGRCHDVPERLMVADVFAFPSLYEGLPGALIEAMLAGCPIVASDIAQVRELIEHEQSGLIVPAGDEQALAAGIGRLLEDRELATRLAAEARRIAMEKYDIKVVTRQMEDLYHQVLAEGGS